MMVWKMTFVPTMEIFSVHVSFWECRFWQRAVINFFRRQKHRGTVWYLEISPTQGRWKAILLILVEQEWLGDVSRLIFADIGVIGVRQWNRPHHQQPFRWISGISSHPKKGVFRIIFPHFMGETMNQIASATETGWWWTKLPCRFLHPWMY